MPIAAGKLRVLIATTNGPVEVLLLTEEDAAIGRCVACIGGTTETADIAAGYHAFVVRPTGVIESRFGHSCYRLDVSARIDAGSSWQLGVLAAHGLLAAGRLAQENDAAGAVGAVLWATGSVRPVDLTVGAVSHVPEKIANSLDRIKQERAAGRRVLLALPAGNAEEVPPTLAGELTTLGVETVALAHVQALFEALALPLPEGPARLPVAAAGSSPAAAAAPPAPLAPARSAVAKRRWIAGAAAGAVLLAVGGAAAIVLAHRGEWQNAVSSAPQLAPAPPLTAAPARVPLVPEQVPFVTAEDRARIRADYMTAPDYKALAMSFVKIAFVTGQETQEAADHAALEVCENQNRGAPAKSDAECELYASGNIVVTRRNRPPMPPEPWVVRNPAVERPFATAQVPLINRSSQERLEKGYPHATRSKALILSPTQVWWYTSAQASPEEAMRRSLERCGYSVGSACMVIAVDDTFVVPIPTSARVVGFYQHDALFGVAQQTRDEVARRLAGAPNAWNAVAVGNDGKVGVAVGAGSEQSARDGALADCASHDHDCHIVVLGPFLVEAGSQSPDPGPAPPKPHEPEPAQPQVQNQAPPPAAPSPRAVLDPDRVPYVSTREKNRIRDEYMAAPDYKALATSHMHMAFVTGQPSQDAANRGAVDACEKLGAKSRLNKAETTCDLYAAGNAVVTLHDPPPMPPEPWVVRNRAVEQPFDVDRLAMVEPAERERIRKGYPHYAAAKAFAMAANGRWAYTSSQSSPDDAIRIILERCGWLASSACTIIALDDTFVIPIPALAKPVALYQPEKLAGVTSETRDEVARRLASAPNAWNAVAVGADGHVGIALAADSEQDAFDAALADCSQHDHACRIAVIGPFLVDMTDPPEKRAATP